MSNKRCCFAGHSKIYDRDVVQREIISCAEQLINEYGVNEFFVGNYGEFDSCAAGAVKKLKEKYDIKLILIIPYLTKEINENKEYYKNSFDEICVATIPEKVPAKYRILYANRYMADNCDYIICYVNSSWGGAAKTLEYAKKLNRKIVNLAH